ncbi:MAG: pyridoxal phosphate-dependent aminotransferase [Candidatus Methanomethylophilaceae archaeon]|jgi:aspartate aminotransferase
MVSRRVQDILASQTVAISNKVSRLKAEGQDIISFSMGEPDFNTPQNIVQSCIDSLNSGFTHYTPSPGIPELRTAVAEIACRENGIGCKPGNVLVTPTKHAIFMACLAYLDPGDEVILPDPAWASYEACIRLACAKPVFVPTEFENDFVIDPALIEAAITPKTKMMIINTPSNPTGCVIPEKVLREIAKIAIEHDIMILSDEIYEKVIYEGKHVSMASFPGMFGRTITVSGFSKTYAMTGWRVGWAIADEEHIININKLQSHSISCCVSFAQQAAVEALVGPQDERKRFLKIFKQRRDLAIDLIDDMKGLDVNVPQGAFYLFPKYSADIKSSVLAHKLLDSAHVAVTPGSAFGPAGEGFFRISYATSEDQIREGFARIKKFLDEY